MAQKTYYEVLGVSKNATDDEIKKAFRSLAAKNHPDRGGDEKRFKEISEAYTTLSDKAKRQEYDQMLQFGGIPGSGFYGGSSAGFGGFGGAQGYNVNLNDFFSNMGDIPFDFSGFRQTQQHKRRRAGSDLTLRLSLTFDEAFNGVTKKMIYKIPSTQEEHTLTVNVPPGAHDGGKLRYRGKGEFGINGGARGDLIVVTEIAPHPLFTREGAHVRMTLPISCYEAALGATIKIPTPSKKVVMLKIPAGTQSGKVLKCKGFGAPKVSKKSSQTASSSHGDLFVTIEVVIPQHLTADEKKLMEQLQSADTRSYRGELESYGSTQEK